MHRHVSVGGGKAWGSYYKIIDTHARILRVLGLLYRSCTYRVHIVYTCIHIAYFVADTCNYMVYACFSRGVTEPVRLASYASRVLLRNMYMYCLWSCTCLGS